MRLFRKLLIRWRERNYDECDGDHRWIVYSTAVRDGCLELLCQRCGLFGSVDDPTKEEWSAAFYAPDAPYAWDDASRVETSFASGQEMRQMMREKGLPV